jgi:hypothetical protein
MLGRPTLVAAQSAHVENRCPPLSAGSYEELDARVQLLLRGEARPHPLPAVVCEANGSWVEWEGRKYPILGRAAIEDEVVDIVEGVLHDAERRAEADPRNVEESAVAAGEPMLERGGGTPPAPPAAAQPADPRAKRASDARGGGIAVGFETELPSATVGTAFGPTFDFGGSIGPLLIGGREAVRFASSNRSVVFMDFQVALAMGAPLDPAARFGFVTRFGAEWMIAYPEGNSGQAAVVPVLDLGVRWAHHWPVLAAWVGADARFRTSKLVLRGNSTLVANDVGASLTLGVAFVDWSRK